MGLLRKKLIDEDVLKIIEHKNLIKRLLTFILGLLIYSVAYNVFFLKNNLVYGGTGGLATVLQDYLDPSITMLLFSAFTLILTYIFFDKKTALNSLLGSILLPILVALTSKIELSIPDDDLMLVAIFGAVITAIGNGMAAKTGFSSGGMDNLIHLLVAKFKISHGKAFMFVNGIIVIAGGYKFGWKTLLYAIIIIYIMSIVTDKVILGISQNKTFFIVTQEEERVKNYIQKNLSRALTVLDAHGGYTNGRKKVIMLVIPTSEYFKAKEGILEIDPNAFFTICDSYQVYNAYTKNKEVK